jgi:hypothetical protein
LAQVAFRLKPVFSIVARLAAARVGEFVGARRNLRRILFFEHKQKVVSVEMSKPLIPGDWAERCESREIESDAATPVVHNNFRGP